MFDLKKRPHNFLLLTVILFLIASLFVSNQALDIHLHDTYFVLSLSHIVWPIISWLLTFWTLYLLTKHILFSKVLTWLHIILIVLASLFLLAILSFSNDQRITGTQGRYYDFSNWEAIVQSDGLAKAILLMIFAIIPGLFIYIINLTMGVIKKFPGRRKQ